MYSPRLFWSTVVVGGALWTPILCQREVEFFYNTQNDTCAYGGQTSQADDNSNHGGLCAWTPASARLYACPAPDPTCWSWDQTCAKGTFTAGDGQILCGDSTYSWCCTDQETCTTTPGQINICISDFSSPNSGVALDVAVAAELSTLGVASVATDVQTASPSVFSTRIVDSTGASYTGSFTTTTSATSSATTTPGSKTSGSSAAATSTSTSSGLTSSGFKVTTGTIAGIAVGAAVLIIIGVLVIWVIMRRRSRRSAVPASEPYRHDPGKEQYSVYNTQPDAKAFPPSSGYQYQNQQQYHEAPAWQAPHNEMPTNYSRSEMP